MGFQENLAGLPPSDHLARIELVGSEGIAGIIENRSGSQGSLRIYQHLALRFGRIGPAAAEAGLSLYAEHTEDARLNPGKHPNIDRLLAILAGGPSLSVHLVRAPRQMA